MQLSSFYLIILSSITFTYPSSFHTQPQIDSDPNHLPGRILTPQQLDGYLRMDSHEFNMTSSSIPTFTLSTDTMLTILFGTMGLMFAALQAVFSWQSVRELRQRNARD